MSFEVGQFVKGVDSGMIVLVLRCIEGHSYFFGLSEFGVWSNFEHGWLETYTPTSEELATFRALFAPVLAAVGAIVPKFQVGDDVGYGGKNYHHKISVIKTRIRYGMDNGDELDEESIRGVWVAPTPSPLEVGDRVVVPGGKAGKIKAIDGDVHFIAMDSGTHALYGRDELTWAGCGREGSEL